MIPSADFTCNLSRLGSSITCTSCYIKPGLSWNRAVKSSQQRRYTAIMEKKSYIELGRFLTNKGIQEEVVDALIENEVTGESFLLLTEQEIKEIAPRIGERVKLRQLINKHKVIFLCSIKFRLTLLTYCRAKVILKLKVWNWNVCPQVALPVHGSSSQLHQVHCPPLL